MTAEETTQQEEKEAPSQEEIRNLQDKFHNLLDQRNHYNDLAKEARDGRNLLNDQRREKAELLEELKGKRDAANDEMRKHKERRNAYQDQAKALIAQKKGKTGALERSLPLRVRKLRNDIENALERQETTVMAPHKERDLIDSVRHMQAELDRLEKELAKQKTIEVDLDDTDQAIDQLFAQADAEHEKVKKWNETARGHHEKFVATIKEIRVVQKEADTKHKEFVAIKEKADEYHNKAMELREKVMAVRGERRAEFQRRRDEINSVNRAARQNVNDPKAIEKANEDALEQLKKGGKISLGG